MVQQNAILVVNTTRFSPASLWKLLGQRETLGTRTSPVTYPYWENIARVAEYRCTSLLLAEIVLLALAGLISLVWLAISWNRIGTAVKHGAIRLRDWVTHIWKNRNRPDKNRRKGETV